jgi:dihydrofolate reductase
MRQIVASAKVSLDGVMQGEGGAQEDPSDGFDLGGWSAPYGDDKAGAAVMSLLGTLEKPNDLLLGRKTYDIFANYWPHVPADNPIGPVFNKAKKYVLSRGSKKPEWANTQELRGIDDLKRVKAEGGAEIVLWGSSTLYPQLLDADLIDRLLLLICPIVLGKGKRLFGSLSHPFAPKLTKYEVTSKGVIIASYERTPER